MLGRPDCSCGILRSVGTLGRGCCSSLDLWLKPVEAPDRSWPRPLLTFGNVGKALSCGSVLGDEEALCSLAFSAAFHSSMVIFLGSFETGA